MPYTIQREAGTGLYVVTDTNGQAIQREAGGAARFNRPCEARRAFRPWLTPKTPPEVWRTAYRRGKFYPERNRKARDTTRRACRSLKYANHGDFSDPVWFTPYLPEFQAEPWGLGPEYGKFLKF